MHHFAPSGHASNHTGLRLEGRPTNSTLELQRFDVWDPAAKVVVHPGGGAQPTTQGPPDVRYFKGSVAGAPGSTVVLAVDAAGGVSGMATHGRQHWTLGRPALSPQAAAAGVAPAGLSSRRATAGTNVAADRQAFHCGASSLEAERPPHAAQQQASSSGSISPTLAAVSGWPHLCLERSLVLMPATEWVTCQQHADTWRCILPNPSPSLNPVSRPRSSSLP